MTSLDLDSLNGEKFSANLVKWRRKRRKRNLYVRSIKLFRFWGKRVCRSIEAIRWANANLTLHTPLGCTRSDNSRIFKHLGYDIHRTSSGSFFFSLPSSLPLSLLFHECLLTCGFLGYFLCSIASHRSNELSWGLASPILASSDTRPIRKPWEGKWANVGEKEPEKCDCYVSRLGKSKN